MSMTSSSHASHRRRPHCLLRCCFISLIGSYLLALGRPSRTLPWVFVLIHTDPLAKYFHIPTLFTGNRSYLAFIRASQCINLYTRLEREDTISFKLVTSDHLQDETVNHK
ncbi:hypothetical protein QCA50_009726 [Cerrena zonata]|uniref:Secreted protein n=1 Tax=Cerrena zonata TaxID=2478898 RepID=A0AAW0G2H4_9APHY